jgi:UDP-3-O-[3-hydroxymyristoyl] glucosamine N-acyltransferase
MAKSLKELARLIEGEVFGDGNLKIEGVASAEEAKEGDITFACNSRYLKEVEKGSASAVIVFQEVKKSSKPFLRVDNPRLAFAKVLEVFTPPREEPKGIHPTAILGKNVELGKGVSIQAYVVIGDKVKIGKGVALYPGIYIGKNVVIGNNTLIYSQVVVREEVIIGKNVIIHSGTVIGSDGFGFVEGGGVHHKIPQVGKVIIEDDVEIGANVTIDRATTRVTTVKKGTKIDNLVHIAHNVTVGEDCLLVAQVGISGSVQIGNKVTLAGQSGVAGHLSIGDRVLVTAKSGVTKSISSNSRVSGFPARPYREENKIKVALQKMPQLLKVLPQVFKSLQRLGKRIEKMEEKIESGR